MGPTSTHATSSAGTLTVESVQQLVLSALSALAFEVSPMPSYLDTDLLILWSLITWLVPWTFEQCSHLQWHQNIQIVDGNTLSITSVEDINPSFWDVLVFLGLVLKLISIGQLMDNNCNVNFFHVGCFMQDQALGKVIAREPKVGRLLPLQFSLPSLFCL